MEYLLVLDFLGTFIFALTGAVKAVRHQLDLLGVLVLAIFTGVGGGIARDVVLGLTPPAAFHNELYLVLCIVAGLLVFFSAPRIARSWPLIRIGDALGLGVFAMIGAWKGLEAGLGPIGVVLIGTLTPVGGGVIRDLLVSEVPVVIRTDFYATAAALGSLVLWLLIQLGLDLSLAAAIGLATATGARLLAMFLHINLPQAKS